MKPISGLLELPDPGKLQARVDSIKATPCGLGPADLVILTKKGPNGSFKTYSYFSGLDIFKEQDAISFFEALSTQIPHKMLKIQQYQIENILICCWNPFCKLDTRIEVTSAKSVSLKVYDTENKIVEKPDNVWREVGLSSLLRNWIPYDQLYRSIYNLWYVDSYPLNMLNPKTLSDDDISYIVDYLQPSLDLEYALAAYLLANCQNQEFYNKVAQLKKPFPRLIAAILRFVPLSSSIAERLYDDLNTSHQICPDDITIIKALLELSHHRNDKAKIQSIANYFKNSAWSSPLSCMCFAKSFINSKKYEEAKITVNGSFYCREYKEPEHSKFSPKLPEKPSGRAPRSVPRSIEKEIIESQLDEESDFIYRVVFELRESYGVMRLKDAKKYPTIRPKNGEIPQQSYKGNTNMSFNGEAPMHGDDLDDLFDPGVTSSMAVPQSFYYLPFSTYFFDVLEVIDEESDHLAKLKRDGSVSSQEDARRAAVLALKTGDREALRIALAFFESKRRLRPVHFLLEMAIYARSGGDVPDYKDTKVRWTLGERNALNVVQKIASNLKTLI